MSDAVQEPEWVDHAIWWQVYPLGFSGADTTGVDRTRHGGLDRIAAWLDHAVELGASGLALGPIFASSGHGYDTVDHYRIDERLGDDAEFDRLIASAHDRGLRVLLDGVFNHVGAHHSAVSEHPAWFAHDGDQLAVFEGHPGLVEFDHARPEVAGLVVDVMNHWLDRGADGWRLDAAYAVPTSFWGSVVPRVRAHHPDAYLVGEVIHGDYAQFVRDSGIDTVTQYELWKATWSALADGNFFELDHALGRHDDLLDTFVPWTFVGNHDVTRIVDQVGDRRHLPHALAVLFTVAGTPAVYYGDEFGWGGIKTERVGGDDDIRPPAPDQPVPLADIRPEEGDVLRQHQELIGLRHRHPWLHRARISTVALDNTTYAYDVSAGPESLRVVLNLGDKLFDISGDGTVQAGQAEVARGRIQVPPHGWAVIGD